MEVVWCFLLPILCVRAHVCVRERGIKVFYYGWNHVYADSAYCLCCEEFALVFVQFEVSVEQFKNIVSTLMLYFSRLRPIPVTCCLLMQL